MAESQGDNSQASIPDPKKVRIEVLDRNVNVKKLRLGEKIRVSRIYALLAKSLKGDNWIKLSDGSSVPRVVDLNNFRLQDILDTAPNFLHDIELHYPEFLRLTTDLQEDEIQRIDVPDLFELGIACWNHNGFKTIMEESLGKVLSGAEEKAPEGSPSSKGTSKT